VRSRRRLAAVAIGTGAAWLMTGLTVLAASPSPDPVAGDAAVVVGAAAVVGATDGVVAAGVTVHDCEPLSSPVATPVSTAMITATVTARARRLVVDILGSNKRNEVS